MSYAVWAVSSTFSLFVVARVISGLAKGNITIATAVVADVTNSKTRGKGMVCKPAPRELVYDCSCKVFLFSSLSYR